MSPKFKKRELTIEHLIYFSNKVTKINITVCIIYGIYFIYDVQLQIFPLSAANQKLCELNI